jgi:hypothetical protein
VLPPSSGILEKRKHEVSETGSISVLRRGEGTYSVGPLERVISNFNGAQQSRCLPSHLRTEPDPVSETLCDPVILCVIHRQMKMVGLQSVCVHLQDKQAGRQDDR